MDPATIATIGSMLGQGLMQFFGKDEPNIPQSMPAPRPGQPMGGQPQPMSVNNMPDQNQLAMQLLLGIMTQLPQLFQQQGFGGGMQQPQQPMQQPWNAFNQPPGVG